MLHLTIGCPFDLDIIRNFSSNINLEISFYGSPPNFILDGGRIIKENSNNFYSAIEYFKRNKIPFNLCCNSVLNSEEITLSKKLFYFLEKIYSPINGVIISRHWIANEIKKKFPDFKYIFSSIGIITEKWDEDYIFSNYDIVVCPVNYTKNFTFLSSSENWSKLEVFLNNECVGFGENCIKHYRYNSEVNNGKKRDVFICPNLKTVRYNLEFTKNDVIDYIKLGVKKFKIIDRTSNNQNYQHYIDLIIEANDSLK